MVHVHARNGLPDLQRPCAEHARLLVLCHVGRRGAVLVGHLLGLFCVDSVLRLVSGSRGGRGIARDDNVVVEVVRVLAALGIVDVAVQKIGLGLLVEVNGAATGERELVGWCCSAYGAWGAWDGMHKTRTGLETYS
jgi:hypothetical protein